MQDEANRRSLFEDYGTTNTNSSNSGSQELTYEERRGKRMKETKQSTQKSLRMLDESIGIGVATNDKLDEQGETIERIKGNMDVIEMHLASSDRILRGMSSWWGWTKNAFTTDVSYVPKTKPLEDQPKSIHSPRSNENPQTNSTRSNLSSNETKKEISYKGDTAFNEYMEDTEKDLDEMSKRLGILKQLGRDMGDRINDHNRELDKLQPRVDHVNERLSKNTKIVKTLL